MAQIIEIKNGNRVIKVLADSETPSNGWCSILGFWTKRYTLGGKFFKTPFSLPAILIAESFGFDLSTEDGIKNAVHNKGESIKSYKDDQLMNFFSSLSSDPPECLSALDAFIGKGLEVIYNHTVYEDETVLAVIEAKETDPLAHHNHKPVPSQQFTTVIDATHRDYIIITDKNIKIIKRDSVPSFIARTQIYHINIPLKEIAKLEFDITKNPVMLAIFVSDTIKHTLTFTNKDDMSHAIDLISFLISIISADEKAETSNPGNLNITPAEKVKKLYEDGIIDKEEYEKVKKKISI